MSSAWRHRNGRHSPARCAASWTAASVYTRPGTMRYATAAQLAAQAWSQAAGPGQVFGTATSQNATNELRKAGVQVAENTTRLLAYIQRGRIGPGSLIV